MVNAFWTGVGWARNLTVAVLVLATAGSGRLHAQSPIPGETITVERLVIDAWITQPDGSAVANVGPEDLEVRIAGRPARVEAVDFYGIDGEPADSTAHPDARHDFLQPRGRLFVYFFQTDFQRARVRGQMRMMHHATEMLNELTEWDRVAVVSFDSHLKLHQDFTRDRDVLAAAIARTIEIGATPEHVEAGVSGPSLARSISRAEARKAAKPESALLLLARALEDIEGQKNLIYFGWGLGRYGAGGVTHEPQWAPARQLLENARTAMFVLDTSDADYHSLEVALKDAAEKTGGYYLQTFRFPEQAVARLGRTLAGRYEIVVVIDGMPRGVHPVDVRLRGRRGEIWTRSTYTLR